MLKRFLEETTTKQLHVTMLWQAFSNIFDSLTLQFCPVLKMDQTSYNKKGSAVSSLALIKHSVLGYSGIAR